MAVKYWQMKLKGVKSLDEIHGTVGKSPANIVRIHVEAGETHVYLAADESLHPHVSEATKAAGNLQEIAAADVTRL
jgi:hypothetical protein